MKRGSYEFYILWFEYFLCDEHYVQTEEERRQFQVLLKEWSNQFRYDRQLLEQMTIENGRSSGEINHRQTQQTKRSTKGLFY